MGVGDLPVGDDDRGVDPGDLGVAPTGFSRRKLSFSSLNFTVTRHSISGVYTRPGEENLVIRKYRDGNTWTLPLPSGFLEVYTSPSKKVTELLTVSRLTRTRGIVSH